MTWPTTSDYVERGATLPRFAGGAQNTDLPPSEGPRACPECGCSLEEHHFGADYIQYAAAFINGGESPRDGVNPCGDCCRCPRDKDGE